MKYWYSAEGDIFSSDESHGAFYEFDTKEEAITAGKGFLRQQLNAALDEIQYTKKALSKLEAKDIVVNRSEDLVLDYEDF
jgi:hypothetical protein